MFIYILFFLLFGVRIMCKLLFNLYFLIFCFDFINMGCVYIVFLKLSSNIDKFNVLKCINIIFLNNLIKYE